MIVHGVYYDVMFKVSFIGTFVNKLSTSNDAGSFGCFTVIIISMNSWVDSIMWRFCINDAINAFGYVVGYCPHL